MLKRVIIYGLILAPVVAFAQGKKAGKESRVVMVTGKPMTSIDSVMVKQLFFSALHEKTVENFPLATDLFSRVLQTDPG